MFYSASLRSGDVWRGRRPWAPICFLLVLMGTTPVMTGTALGSHSNGAAHTAVKARTAIETDTIKPVRSIKPARSAAWNIGRNIVNAMEYPWSAIGRINAGGRNFCTGVLISAKHVLTEAHCLFNATEGRWWSRKELYFIAGYQSDKYLIHSKILAYDVPPDYLPRQGRTLANVMSDWAVITLETSVGYQAGWFALQWLDRTVQARIRRGEAFVLQAGYRQAASHGISVNVGCSFQTFAKADKGLQGACSRLQAAPELPTFIFMDGEVRAVANQVMRSRTVTNGAARDITRSIRNAGAVWGKSRAPAHNSPAASVPRDTITTLLTSLGFMNGATAGKDGESLTRAISDFQGRSGLPVTGRPSLPLLGQLMDVTF